MPLDNLSNLPNGYLNPFTKNNTKKLYLDVNVDSDQIILQQLIKDKHTNDVLDSVAEFKAVVIKVLDENEGAKSFLENIITSQFGLKNQMVRFIGVIPELHGHLGEFYKSENLDFLNLYPTFVGPADLGVPDEGSIVRVSFDDIKTQTGPKYVGAYSSQGGAIGSTSGASKNGPPPQDASAKKTWKKPPIKVVVPKPIVNPNDDQLINAGKQAIISALDYFYEYIEDPDSDVGPNRPDKDVINADLIDQIIRKGGYAVSKKKNPSGRYEQDTKFGENKQIIRQADFEWCGAFAAACWSNSNLNLTIRQNYWASTTGIYLYANYRYESWMNETKLKEFEDDNPKTKRKVLELKNASIQQIIEFGPREGDILVVGQTRSSNGDHICLVQSFDPNTKTFYTIEGNGNGQMPDGKQDHGCIRGKRTDKDLPQRIVRPGYKDIGLSGGV
jgi:hypothetical protein